MLRNFAMCSNAKLTKLIDSVNFLFVFIKSFILEVKGLQLVSINSFKLKKGI